MESFKEADSKGFVENFRICIKLAKLLLLYFRNVFVYEQQKPLDTTT